jgi:23S rRNA (cytidine1920-2'-O)/16S rRNA (cytidine1409-2'-O)-methyltransferase
MRDVTAGSLAQAAGPGAVPVDAVVADLSFISLTAVMQTLTGPVVRPGGDLVLLVKPQFEVGRAEASRGRGVIRDPGLWLAALRKVASSLEASGAVIMGAVRSPIAGASGNTEFFVHAVAPAPGDGVQPLPSTSDSFLRAAVGDASGAGE